MRADGRSNDLDFQHICLVTPDLEAVAMPLQAELDHSAIGVVVRLAYLTPSGGRPMPLDQGAADAAHWLIRLAVGASLGYRRALQVPDPDGHALERVSD